MKLKLCGLAHSWLGWLITAGILLFVATPAWAHDEAGCSVNVSANKVNVCVGEPVHITVTPSSCCDNTQTNFTVTYDTSGNYTVSTQICGTTGSVQIHVSEITNLSPSVVTMCRGSFMPFTALANPTNASCTPTWEVVPSTAGTLTASGRTATLSLSTNYVGSTATLYAYCGTMTNSAAITAIDTTMGISSQPVSQVGCLGQPTNISVTATGNSLTYQWRKDGVKISNSSNFFGWTTSTLTVSNSGQSVYKTVWASNISGVLFFSVTNGQTYAYEASGCATWTNPAGGFSDPDGNTYTTDCATFTGGPAVAPTNFTCPGLAMYSFVGKVGTNRIQLGRSGTFKAPATAGLYLYFNDDHKSSSYLDNSGSWSVSVTPKFLAGNYDVIVTSDCGSMISTAATLALSTACDGIPDWWRAQYFGGSGMTTNSTNCATCNPDGDCLNNLQEYQHGADPLNPSPTAVVSGSATICAGQSTTVQTALTGTGPWTVTWSDGFTSNNITATTVTRNVNPTSTITYTVTAVSDSICSSGTSSGSATVTVNNAPLVTSNPTNLTVFAGSSASFTATASGDPVPTVQWQVSTDGVAFNNISGATNTTLTFITSEWDNGKKFRAVFGNTCGSVTSLTATLTTVISPNLVGWWPFDEGTGTATFDASGNGHNGALSGPSWVTGVLSNALSFQTYSDQYALVPPGGTVTGTFTVAFWVLPIPDDTYDNKTILDSGSEDYNAAFYFSLYGNCTRVHGWFGNGSVGVASLDADFPYAYMMGTWYHIACVVTPTNYTIYVNGAIIGSVSYAATNPMLVDVNRPIMIGDNHDVTGYTFNGSIDDVRVYNRALASNEVVTLYNVDTITDGIPNWWRARYFGSGSKADNTSCASCDPDGDGFTNLQEYHAGTDPLHSPVPTFRPEGGAYLTAQSVTISCVTAGATIHYTTNGLEPTTNSPVIESGGTVTVSAPTMLRARSFKTGMTTSDTKNALYQIGARVAAGWDYSFALETNGMLWAWGYNGYGQLGDGTTVNQSFPELVSGISNVWAVAGGQYHTVAADTNGTVWTWGLNNQGQLGDGTSAERHVPMALSGVGNVVAVAAGQSHTLAVRSNGTVWTWGYNNYGQLGIGFSGGTTNWPVQAVGLTQVIGVAAGASHSVALRSDETVWTWGYNGNGQLGRIGNQTVPKQVNGLSNVVAIAAGQYHTVALCADGTVWTWGNNGYGQLGRSGNNALPGQVSGLSNVVAIAAGQYHTLAVTATGQVYAWGRNDNGQLGLGASGGYQTTPQLVSSLSGVSAISAGGQYSLAVQGAGVIWAWGVNTYGQIGDGTTTTRLSPTMVHTAFDSDGDGLPDIIDADPTHYDHTSPTFTVIYPQAEATIP
jgi:alpha-tubulin suppressor-like RCC1 family protein